MTQTPSEKSPFLNLPLDKLVTAIERSLDRLESPPSGKYGAQELLYLVDHIGYVLELKKNEISSDYRRLSSRQEDVRRGILQVAAPDTYHVLEMLEDILGIHGGGTPENKNVGENKQ
ncbi:MAG: hypothetical protein RL557_143 [archaeon]